MLLIGGANILWAERLTVNGGFGWDGLLYGAWAKNFYQSIFVTRVPAYYAQRILPSALVHYGLRLLHVPLTDQNIIQAFELYNLLLLLLSVYVWGLIADELQLHNQGKWLGFCFLFLSFAQLKQNFYSPVGTDTSAFALGLLMCYCFLKDRPLGLLAVIIAGGFTWPTVPYMAALLYVLPRPHPPNQRPPTDALNVPTLGPFNYATLAALGVAGFMLLAYLALTLHHFAERLQTFSWGVRVDTAVVYLSVLAIIGYLFFGLRRAAADARLFVPRAVWRAIRWQRVAVAFVVLLLLRWCVHHLASGEQITWDSPKTFAFYTLMTALTEPFIFLVAHAVYYGPAILLLLFCWRPFCDSLSEFGLGLRALVILNVLLSINPQSRYQINVVGVFVMLLVRLLDRYGLSYRSLPFWALLCLGYSKVWYVFNTAPQIYDGTMASLLRFPLQHYFMNTGPWMSHEMYLVQGGVVLATAILLYILLRRNWLVLRWREARGGTRGAPPTAEPAQPVGAISL